VRSARHTPHFTWPAFACGSARHRPKRFWLADALSTHCVHTATPLQQLQSPSTQPTPSLTHLQCGQCAFTATPTRSPTSWNLDRTYLTCRVRVATLSAQLHPRLHDTNTRRYSKHDLLLCTTASTLARLGICFDAKHDRLLCATSPTLATMVHLTVCGQHWPPYQLRLSSV
jgi:hypothetical protein